MNNLTPFEKALLQEYERLENNFKTYGPDETDTLKTFANTLQGLSSKFEAMTKRQNAIETRLNALTNLLETQNSSTENLITQVMRLIEAQDD